MGGGGGIFATFSVVVRSLHSFLTVVYTDVLDIIGSEGHIYVTFKSSSDKRNSLDNYRMWDKHWIWTHLFAFLLTAWKTLFFSFVAQPPDKGKDDELQKRSHIWLCDWLKKYINVWLFKKTWKSNRAPGNRVTFCQKERERERERSVALRCFS